MLVDSESSMSCHIVPCFVCVVLLCVHAACMHVSCVPAAILTFDFVCVYFTWS
jgi:hypothetical protein